MQTKHTTEDAAREAARKLGRETVQIVESKNEGLKDNGPWIYYLESGLDLENGMIRSWERLVYSGKGASA